MLGQEEIEEKLLMRPGNISMLLAETGGLRVQVTSPALGSANIRVQGIRGRYTQLLADGLPLYGGQASSLGLLQIAPSDLGQVEVIKGSSSAPYGGQALGGVVNLVSKRPAGDAEGELILDRVRLVNADDTTRTHGAEALARWRRGPYTVTASYPYVDATEPDETEASRREVPLTPRHSAGIVAMWEEHDRGRFGLEVYYTGTQLLENNPYRSGGETYFEIGLLGEIVLGRYRLFLNLENLLNVRQTREDPLVRPSRAPVGLWTVDAWAPLEGFVANAGVRIAWGS